MWTQTCAHTHTYTRAYTAAHTHTCIHINMQRQRHAHIQTLKTKPISPLSVWSHAPRNQNSRRAGLLGTNMNLGEVLTTGKRGQRQTLREYKGCMLRLFTFRTTSSTQHPKPDWHQHALLQAECSPHQDDWDNERVPCLQRMSGVVWEPFISRRLSEIVWALAKQPVLIRDGRSHRDTGEVSHYFASSEVELDSYHFAGLAHQECAVWRNSVLTGIHLDRHFILMWGKTKTYQIEHGLLIHEKCKWTMAIFELIEEQKMKVF